MAAAFLCGLYGPLNSIRSCYDGTRLPEIVRYLAGGDRAMPDLLYIGGTFAFFALMLGYVVACARLGRHQDAGEGGHESR